MPHLLLSALLTLLACSLSSSAVFSDDPLPSWNSGATKLSILQFVSQTTTAGPAYVPKQDRIAVFDNDGTLWPENPLPFQLTFAIDQLKAAASRHPEWKDDQLLGAVLADNPDVLKQDVHGAIQKILGVTHAGMTTEQFEENVRDWLKTARHPRYKRAYNELAYQPMLELLEHLRANGFRTFIVSGGGADFMRVWAEEAYGIPPEQVIGSVGEIHFDFTGPRPVLVKDAKIAFIDDKAGKPVAIHRQIGRRPVAAFGNSDGDKQMLEWTTVGNNPSFGLIVHHTDGEREYAYDSNPSSSGKLVEALKDAPERGWVVVDMKRDWNTLFAEESLADEAPTGNESLSKMQSELFETVWWAEDIDGKGVVDRSHSTLMISKAGEVTGDGGVNRYRGTMSSDKGVVQFGPMAVTRRAGPEALMEQERRFLNALSRVRTLRVESDSLLHAYDAAAKEIIRFWAEK